MMLREESRRLNLWRSSFVSRNFTLLSFSPTAFNFSKVASSSGVLSLGDGIAVKEKMDLAFNSFSL